MWGIFSKSILNSETYYVLLYYREETYDVPLYYREETYDVPLHYREETLIYLYM